MKKSLMLVAVSSFALGWAGVAHAQILTDGGFESSGVGTSVGNKNTNGFNSTSSPGWANVIGTASDSGIQNGTSTTGLPGAISNASQAGNYFAFESSQDYASNGGAYQITSTTAAANDTLTLTWWAANAYSPAAGAPVQVVDILASSDGSLSDATVLATTATGGVQASGYALPPVTATGGGNGTAYQEYTLTVNVPTADANDDIGVSFATTAVAGNYYASYDSFSLTDTAAPEPSSLALALVGLGGLFLVNRFRRSLA